MTLGSRAIRDMLAQVGFAEGARSSEVAPGIQAEAFVSDYAHLYMVNCIDFVDSDWLEIVRRTDRMVLDEVRSAELADGGVIDAHVCFVVSSEDRPLEWAQSNEPLVRNVSRKYWISISKLEQELTNRLTILPIASSPPFGPSARLSLSPDESAWLGDLISEGAGSQYSSFISQLKSSK